MGLLLPTSLVGLLPLPLGSHSRGRPETHLPCGSSHNSCRSKQVALSCSKILGVEEPAMSQWVALVQSMSRARTSWWGPDPCLRHQALPRWWATTGLHAPCLRSAVMVHIAGHRLSWSMPTSMVMVGSPWVPHPVERREEHEWNAPADGVEFRCWWTCVVVG